MTAPVVLTAGEALVDWVCTDRGVNLAQANSFHKAPGGAPMNVAVALSRLGVPTAFAGRVGADPFGTWLRAILAVEGVDTSLMQTAHDRQTRMAYVVTDAAGDRELAAFSDVACADADLAVGDVPDEALQGIRAFYFGSLGLKATPSRDALLDTARRVRSGPGLVVFDPNVRPVLWDDRQQLQDVLKSALHQTDLLKVGAEELTHLAPDPDPARAVAHLLDAYPLTAVVVTDGARGAGVHTRTGHVWVPAFAVEVVESTGAGDAFLAGLIAALLAADDGGSQRERVASLPLTAWEPLLRQACAVGALTTRAKGAISALPSRQTLEAFLKAHA